MIKALFIGLWTLFCLTGASIVPIGLYWAYCTIQPTTELARIVTVCGLLYAGGGLALVVALMMFALWAHGLIALLE